MAEKLAYGASIRIKPGFDAWYSDYRKLPALSSIDGWTGVLQGSMVYANGEVRYIVRLKDNRIVIPVPMRFIEALEQASPKRIMWGNALSVFRSGFR